MSIDTVMANPADESVSKKKRSRHDREVDPERSHRSKKKRKGEDTHKAQPSSSRPPSERKDQLSSQYHAEGPSSSLQDSPFHQQTSSLYLPLAPISQSHPLEGLCAEHLAPLILTYYSPFRGVVLSFSDPRLTEDPANHDQKTSKPALAKSINECGVSFVWVTAEFLLFKPTRDQWIEGWVNLQNEDHLGLVCWNLFNASIERKRLPPGWTWIDIGKDQRPGRKDVEYVSQQATASGTEEGGGYYQDEQGNVIDGMISFRVKDIETFFGREKGFLSIEGTMLNAEDDQALAEHETHAKHAR